MKNSYGKEKPCALGPWGALWFEQELMPSKSLNYLVWLQLHRLKGLIWRVHLNSKNPSDLHLECGADHHQHTSLSFSCFSERFFWFLIAPQCWTPRDPRLPPLKSYPLDESFKTFKTKVFAHFASLKLHKFADFSGFHLGSEPSGWILPQAQSTGGESS